jgi:hypothetical protein
MEADRLRDVEPFPASPRSATLCLVAQGYPPSDCRTDSAVASEHCAFLSSSPFPEVGFISLGNCVNLSLLIIPYPNE